MEHDNNKIKRFIECLLPVTQCNIECHYCYIIQESRRTLEPLKLKYPPKVIGQALSLERLGGVCYISICGAGETLIPKESVEIVKEILKQGHFVNITTNGTFSKRFDQLLELPDEYLERLHFSFSYHYLELKKRKLLNIFFENIDKIKKSPASFFVQFNLNDAYLECLDEMIELCKNEVGAYPQVCATRDEAISRKVKLFTNLSPKSYFESVDKVDSPLFRFTYNNFMVKRREFCYAGDWTVILNLGTGIMKPCYASLKFQNIFQDVKKPIKFEGIGCNCRSSYCYNSSHFMSLGVIPELDMESYAEIRDRAQAGWYSERMKLFLQSKLKESNNEYSTMKKRKINIKNNLFKVPESIFAYKNKL